MRGKNVMKKIIIAISSLTVLLSILALIFINKNSKSNN